jgi:hypothetical protein
MKPILLFPIVILLLSCNNSSKNIDKPHQNFSVFSPKKSIVLSNQNNMYFSFLTQVRQHDQYFELFRLRQNTTKNKGIDIYNIYKDSITKTVLNLSESQKRKLKRLRGFIIDSNYIYLIGINKYIAIDLNNRMVKKEAFFNNPEKNNYFPIATSNISPAFISGNKMYLTRIVDATPSDTLYNTNTLMCYDIQIDSLYEMKNTHYPATYLGKCWSHIYDLHPYYAKKDKNLIYSFPISDSIYIYDINKQKIINKINAKYENKNRKVSAIPCDEVWNHQIVNKHLNENFLYSNIIYNPFNNRYYRFVYLPNEKYNPNKKFEITDVKFAIMVFDDKFKHIASSKILNVNPTYISFDYFVTKEGLWISTNNPHNPDYNEDELHFELFSLNK